MTIPKRSNVNTYTRMAASPLPGGLVWRLAEGTPCGYCREIVRCDAVPLNEDGTFVQVCNNCHRDFASVERA